MTLTRPGAVMGTPEYMTPEQAFGAETVDRRSDIYALGVMLFEMLSGRLPVVGDNPQEIAERILHGRVLRLSEARPGLPSDLCALVERAMDPNPDRRFPDVQTLASALLRFAPSLDRLSSVGAFPQGPRGYPTGVATPFKPVAVTPLASDYAAEADTGVPRTMPPDQLGPPPASAGLAPIKTQSMPEVAEPVHAPVLPPKTVVRTRAHRGGGLGWAWVVVAFATVSLGAWYYYEQYVAYSPTPPPQPVPRSTEGQPTPAPPPGVAEPEPVPISPAPRAPDRAEPPSRGPNLPQLPPITLPSELPPLPPIPSEFPRSLPTLPLPPIPGFPAPGLTAPSPSGDAPP
jgi:serine/threonine-protein kinase